MTPSGNEDHARPRPPQSERAERLAGLGLFLAVLLFYVLKAPSFAVPGRWAGMLASFLGLEPSRPLIRPVWSGLMLGAAHLPGPQVALAVNLLTALLGAGACWLLFEIVRRIPLERSLKPPDRRRKDRWSQGMAGVFAALIAAVSLPIMTVATRGDFVMLDIFLLLLALQAGLAYGARPRLALFYASFLAYGLGLADYPVMALLLPGFLGWWSWLLWRSARLKWITLLGGLLALGVGLLAVGAFVSLVGSSPGPGTSASASFLQNLLAFGRLYAIELIKGMPKVGWLLIIGTNLLPLVFVVFRPLAEPGDFFTALGVYPFRIVLFWLGLIALFELPGSPARLLGTQILLVAPYVVVAVWFGHYLGYYFRRLSRFDALWPRVTFATLWIALLLAAGYRNHRATHLDAVAPVVAFADDLVAGLGARTYLITDGALDPSLRLAAHEAGRPLNIINFRHDGRAYGTYYASLLEEPALKTAAYLGVRPLLNEWMNHPASLTGQVALLAMPQVVPSGGMVVQPASLFYQVDLAAADPESLLARNQQAWSSWAPLDLAALKKSDAGYAQLEFLERWRSRLANDTGVALADAGRADLAELAYQQALIFWADNISATLNLLAEARSRQDPAADALKTQLDGQVERNRKLFDLRFVPQICGQVRSAANSLEEAAVLGRAGQTDQALSRLDQAAALLKDGDQVGQFWLANLYLESEKPAESEAIFRRMLEDKPGDVVALSGLLRVAIHRDDFTQAGALLDQLEQAGVDAQKLKVERARLLLRSGDLAAAREQFLTITKQATAPVDAWYSLALIGFLQKDQALVERATPALERDRRYLPGLLLVGEWSLQRRRVDKARSCFEQALSLDPANQHALERLLMIHYMERDAERLQARASILLSMQPDHALGHFALANVHLAQGRLDLAEVALRRCLALGESGQARNDLAWLLGEANQLDEALVHARRAVELQPGDANAWETLADIYLKRGEWAEGWVAIEKAMALAEDRSPGILLTATRLYLASGDRTKAGETFDRLSGMRSVLPPGRIAEIEKLGAELKSSAP